MAAPLVLTVSQFVAVVNGALAPLDGLVVEGEVSGFKIIRDKWVVFTLKDEASSVDCFLTMWEYRQPIEDGMLVRATGRPTLRDNGRFSFRLAKVEPSGEGALKRAFELLRQKLAAEGLFEPARKRPLPFFPEHLALITSRDAAAYTDFLKVLGERLGGLTISFLHTPVQGSAAVTSIISALEYANTGLKNVDVIVLVRGGGSLEDLQSFNDEAVVRAVAASRTPTVVGVGHERDVTLAELAADVRASTPSNAAELVVRTRAEWQLAVAGMIEQVTQAVQDTVVSKRQSVRSWSTQLFHHLTGAIAARQALLTQYTRLLASYSPAKTMARGYSITRTARGTIIREARTARVGERIFTHVHRGRLTSNIYDVQS